MLLRLEKKIRQKLIFQANQKIGVPSDDDDADWGEETSEEAVRQRMEALSGGLGGLVIDNDLEKSEEDRINIFYKFVVNKKNAGPINQGVGAKEVIAEADR